MLRNDLITLLAEKDNDTVTVCVNGFLVAVDSVSYKRGHIALILDPEETRDTLKQIAAGNSGPGESFPD